MTRQRLQVIYKALRAYEQKHHQWPDHLSDLVPEFLPDKSALLDPADRMTGDLGSNLAHKDPKFHVSYSYERDSGVSNGLAQPLGTFPKPDIPGTGWGSWRLVNERQEYFFGDQVPLVRCYLHRPPEEEREPGRDCVLNLTPSGRIYRSDFDWRSHSDSVAFMLWTLERDLSQGTAHVQRVWNLGRVREFLGDDALRLVEPAQHGQLMRSLADAFFAQRDKFTNENRHEGRNACHIAARLYGWLEDLQATLAALDACAKYPGPDWFPIVEKQMRGEALLHAKEWNQAIAVYEELTRARPEVRSYMARLAEALEGAGRKTEAQAWRDKADPGALLLGKQAPDFEVASLDDKTLTLAALRQGSKAVLVNFWFCGCGPCRQEFPFLEQLQQSYKEKGLTIVAINHGDSAEAIRKFVAEGRFTLAVGSDRGGNGQANPVGGRYHVQAFPTNYLIDQDGKIVWRGVGFGPETKQGFLEALAKLGLK